MTFSTWIAKGNPALVLAPMEGVTDAPMRALLTERGGFRFCVSEFLRISQDLLPDRTYYEHVPELYRECRTASGIPIQIQLLGGNEERLALSAVRACSLGAPAIDLNFGCPAPIVNRHDGGATLLKHPERIRSIVQAVRDAVPPEIPVSAKLRLGWEDPQDIFLNAESAVLGGASWITIHARTKVQGYAPPIFWKLIGEVARNLDVPVVANGDIWSLEDFLKCREDSQCEHFMLGRGALADPALPWAIARELGLEDTFQANSFQREFPYRDYPGQWIEILKRFSEISRPFAPRTQYTLRRIKQWLKLGQIGGSVLFFEEIKRAECLEDVFSVLERKLPSLVAD